MPFSTASGSGAGMYSGPKSSSWSLRRSNQRAAYSFSSAATAWPVMRRCVSRHTANRLPPSMYSWPTFMPPV